MKNSMKLAIAALAALALATVIYACDQEKTAAQNGEKTAAGCQHADGATAKAGCGSHCAEGTADAKATGGCQHAAKTQLAGYKDEAGGCPFHSQATEAQRAALVKGAPITLVGHVVCASCDLKQAKECKSMFKAENGDLYAIVGNDAFEKLAGETKHGEKKVEIMGTTAKDDSQSIVLLTSYKIIS